MRRLDAIFSFSSLFIYWNDSHVKFPKLFEREADLIVEHKGEIYHLEL